MTTLNGKIALVTGGSRGAGKGIALELAKAGAYVYVTGRNAGSLQDRGPRTLEGVLDEIHEAGGAGAVIRCDHTNDGETEAVIRQIAAEKGRLDILVNNVWGGNSLPIEIKPMWELPAAHWDNMFDAGVRAQLMTNYYAVPLMRSGGSGAGKLIIHTTFWDDYKYVGNFYYDLSKNALVRMAFGLAAELAEDGIAVIPLSPGWMRTELVLDSLKTDEAHWREVEELQASESTAYIGRAAVALAADPGVLKLSGKPQQVGRLAEEYGFTDTDGRRIPVFRVPE
ncbi:SDR family NAD(P)-dependent oxidoreductase [Paenibacillus sp. MMS20-IR301]|uniref:SDR family NAD(P)-dependent oxidoreductase n=1 Tax=Paenibacillus sp. MMS20-IR301 TaxID=2895946 RepID=UPI0028E6C75D|nr:SDR family NAD(P)-dependent oxidoreductase [Paenibacillus sp. MMS20-IR301]WNS44462.1 SDR family NAD(P)-dependent oxidoreductase [Paenibacillus sp. MMS20-IR301]